MQMARGAVVDLQSVTKKKVAHSRNWALLDSNGETQTLDADKYAIMHRVRIHARDLRILDPLLSYPSTILGRDQAIVLNLEHIKAIITAEEVLLRNPSDEHVIPIMEELCRRLPKGSATQRTDLLGDVQEQLNESHDVDAGDEDESPFEFRALEVALEAICSFLDARTTKLETDVYPALDELTSKCHTRKAMDSKRFTVPIVQELAFNHLLPERYIRSENERPSLSNTPPQIGIPAIDMKLLLGENDCRPKEMEKLAMACHEFFQVLNHGISGSLMERMKRVTREFILLPLQEKVEYAVQEHEGYGEAFVFSEDQQLDWSDLGLLKDEIFSAHAIL